MYITVTACMRLIRNHTDLQFSYSFLFIKIDTLPAPFNNHQRETELRRLHAVGIQTLQSAEQAADRAAQHERDGVVTMHRHPEARGHHPGAMSGKQC